MKRNFVTGLVALLPIGLTVFVVWFAVTKIGGVLEAVFKKIPFLCNLPPFLLSFIGLIVLVIIIYSIGVITRSWIGRKVFGLGENIITRVPLIRTIYTGGKKFTDALFVERAAFKKTVIVEFPRKGVYTLGFLTNEGGWEIKGVENINVYVPTTPNMTTGFYLLLPRSEIIETNLSIDDAVRTIISGGVIVPEERKY